MYIALNTAQFAESSLKLLVICFLGFPLAIRAAQAGFLSRLRITKSGETVPLNTTSADYRDKFHIIVSIGTVALV